MDSDEIIWTKSVWPEDQSIGGDMNHNTDLQTV